MLAGWVGGWVGWTRVDGEWSRHEAAAAQGKQAATDKADAPVCRACLIFSSWDRSRLRRKPSVPNGGMDSSWHMLTSWTLGGGQGADGVGGRREWGASVQRGPRGTLPEQEHGPKPCPPVQSVQGGRLRTYHGPKLYPTPCQKRPTHLSSLSRVSSSLNSRANLTISLGSTWAPARTCGSRGRAA